MASQRDVKNKIASVKNIQKITRAMEMVAAARLRRAEQRIAGLRPYADALRRMTPQAAQAAGSEAAAGAPPSREHLCEPARRGAARSPVTVASPGAFNSQIIRAAIRLGAEISDHEGLKSILVRRPAAAASSSMSFRGYELSGTLHRLLRPARARRRTGDRRRPSWTAYVDGHVDRVEIVYNGYVSPLNRKVTTASRTPPLSQRGRHRRRGRGRRQARHAPRSPPCPPVDYEPDPEKILQPPRSRLRRVSIYRALVESTAGSSALR